MPEGLAFEFVAMDPVLISGIALVISVLSLGWNVLNFVLTGSRVRLEMDFGATNGSALTAFPPKFWTDDIAQQFEAQGVQDRVIVLTASNTGRAPVTVKSFQVDLDNGMKYIPGQSSHGDCKLPYRLEPHSDGTWTVRASAIRTFIQQAGLDRASVRGRVQLATGRVVTSDLWQTIYADNAAGKDRF